MKIVLGVLGLILMISLNPIELARPHKEDAVHPSPIQLDIHHFGGSLPLPWSLRSIWYAGTDKEMGQEYIIGVIIAGHLVPIMVPRADANNTLERVKVRIDGNIANVNIPISKEDPLNNLFYKEFGTQNIRPVELRE